MIGLFEGLSAYEFAHLVQHLAAANLVEEIHRLLSLETSGQRNAWYQAREGRGLAALYLADLEAAWRLAESEAHHREGSAKITSLARQVQYALIQATVRHFVVDLTPSLLAALVAQGVWGWEQGLSYSQQVLDKGKRAEMQSLLLPHLPRPAQEDLLIEILGWAGIPYALERSLPEEHVPRLLEFINTMHDENARTSTLRGLSYYKSLPEEIVDEVLTYALAQRSGQTSDALDAIRWAVEKLSEKGREDEILTVLAAADDLIKTRILSRPPKFNETNLRRALEIALSLSENWQLSEALAALVRYAPMDLVDYVLRNSSRLDTDYYRAPVISASLVRLAELGDKPRALSLLPQVGLEKERANSLAGLAPYLTVTEVQEFLRDLGPVGYGEDRARVEVAMVRRLTELGHYADALNAAINIEHEFYCADALEWIIPRVPDVLFDEALAAVRIIRRPTPQADPSVCLALHAPPDRQQAAIGEALLTIRSTLDAVDYWDANSFWARALVQLAPLLSEAQLAEEVPLGVATFPSAADLQNYASDTERVFEILSPILSAPLLRVILDVDRIVDDGEERARLFAEIARLLGGGAGGSLWLETFVTITNIRDGGKRRDALFELLPQLSAELQEKGVEMARSAIGLMNRWPSRAEALSQLAPLAAEPTRGALLHEALASARNIPCGRGRNEQTERGLEKESNKGLATIACYAIEAGYTDLALDTMRSIKGEYAETEHARVIATLAENGKYTEALQLVDRIRDAFSWCRAIQWMIGYFPEWWRENLAQLFLRESSGIRQGWRNHVLLAIAPYLPEHIRAEVLEEVIDYHVKEFTTGKYVIESLVEAVPLMSEAKRRAKLPYAIKEASALDDVYARESALSVFAVQLARIGWVTEALELARSLKAHSDYVSDKPAKALIGVLSFAPNEQRADLMMEALAATSQVTNLKDRAKCFEALQPYLVTLPKELLSSLLYECLRVGGTRPRRELLTDLHALLPAFVAIGGTEALEGIAGAVQTTARWWP